MIPLSDEVLSVLGRSYTIHTNVESWRGGTLLSDDVPVASASEETDRGRNVPERVTLTVPRVERGFDWSPTTELHPLAANGQQLWVSLGVELGNGVVEWFHRGIFVIESTETEGDEVRVQAAGLLYLIHEARLVSPLQPTGTLTSALRKLVEPALTVVVDAGLTDRSVPSGLNWDEDRLGAVNELINAWPADMYVHEEGYLAVVPPVESDTPVLALTDGLGGTVIRASGTSTREGAYNAVVAKGTASDGGQVIGVAYDNTSSKAIGGPFNDFPVPYFYESPLLTTVGQCNAAAETMLAKIQRSTSREFAVEMVPHPGLQAGDVVTLTTSKFTALPCVVEALTLPYTPNSGAQTLTVRSL